MLATHSDPSHARAAVCGKLERQLASANNSSGNSNKFSRAAAAQATQLQIAKRQARSAGCSVSFVVAGGNKGSCSRINSTIRRMEANLSNLRAKSGNGGGGTNRARILASYEANDCNKRDVVQVSNSARKLPKAEKQRDGLLTILFGGTKVERRLPKPVELASLETRKPSKNKTVKVINGSQGSIDYDISGGRYRTLCVRTCDGYYFPVSFSTSQSRFATDAKACAAMCPGAATELFVHAVPEQEPEEMISLSKQPYAAMPTAFKYRRDGIGADPTCTCQAKPEMDSADAANPSGTVKKVKWIPQPAAKPSMLDDVETRMNVAGRLDAEAIHYLIEGRNSAGSLANQEKIRVVGPVFLPAQSKAEVLPVPGQSTVQ